MITTAPSAVLQSGKTAGQLILDYFNSTLGETAEQQSMRCLCDVNALLQSDVRVVSEDGAVSAGRATLWNGQAKASHHHGVPSQTEPTRAPALNIR